MNEKYLKYDAGYSDTQTVKDENINGYSDSQTILDNDLISRSELKKVLISDIRDNFEFVCLSRVLEKIDNAPTVEVSYLTNCANCERVEKIRAKRPHGKWIFMRGVTCGGYYKCSNCGEVERAEKNYCSNCGARMGVKNEIR